MTEPGEARGCRHVSGNLLLGSAFFGGAVLASILAYPKEVWDIVSYDGSVLDAAINLPLLAVTTAIYFSALRCSCMAGVCGLLFWCAFQVTLCLFLHCVGISIIWNAEFGGVLQNAVWSRASNGVRASRAGASKMRAHLVSPESTVDLRHPKTAIACGVAMGLFCIPADTYYLARDVTAGEYLTTTAHVCAIILGAVTVALLKQVT